MTITAKYAGKCQRCGGRIEPGDRIDWDREARVTAHTDCRVAADRSAPAPPAPKFTAATKVQPGLFSVTVGAERTTLEVTEDGFEEGDGRHVVRAECGGGYRRGFGHLEPGGAFRTWKRAASEFGPALERAERALAVLLGASPTEQVAFGRAYARESGACWVCNHPLTDQESMERGIGPVCAKKRGLL